MRVAFESFKKRYFCTFAERSSYDENNRKADSCGNYVINSKLHFGTMIATILLSNYLHQWPILNRQLAASAASCLRILGAACGMRSRGPQENMRCWRPRWHQLRDSGSKNGFFASAQTWHFVGSMLQYRKRYAKLPAVRYPLFSANKFKGDS